MDQGNSKRDWFKGSNIIVAMVVLMIMLLSCAILLYWYLYIRKSNGDSSDTTSSSQESLSITSSSEPSASSSSSSASNTEAVEQTVVELFQQLVDEHYDEALSLLALNEADWEFMAAFSETNDTATDTGKAAVLKNYCDVMGTCLEVQVLTVNMKSENLYEVTVMFLQPNGDVYELVLEGQEPVSTFTFELQKIVDEYKVIDYPVYHP